MNNGDRSTRLWNRLEPLHKKTNILHMRNIGADRLLAVTAKLVSAYIFTTRIVCFHHHYLYPKYQASRHAAFFCDRTGQFVSDRFGNHTAGFLMMRIICLNNEVYVVTREKPDACSDIRALSHASHTFGLRLMRDSNLAP